MRENEKNQFSYQPTYEELKPYLAFLSGPCPYRYQPTYEELKPWLVKLKVSGFQLPAYL